MRTRMVTYSVAGPRRPIISCSSDCAHCHQPGSPSSTLARPDVGTRSGTTFNTPPSPAAGPVERATAMTQWVCQILYASAHPSAVPTTCLEQRRTGVAEGDPARWLPRPADGLSPAKTLVSGLRRPGSGTGEAACPAPASSITRAGWRFAERRLEVEPGVGELQNDSRSSSESPRCNRRRERVVTTALRWVGGWSPPDLDGARSCWTARDRRGVVP